MLLETLQPGRGDVVEGEARCGPEGEEAPLQLALAAFAPRHHHLARDQAFRLQQARLAAGEVPLHQYERRYFPEIVAELLVRPDQRLQEAPLAGVEAAQHQGQE